MLCVLCRVVWILAHYHRSVLNPTDLVTFDEIVSPHEIAALQKRTSHGTTPVPTVTPTAATPATTITSPSVNVTAATTVTGTSPVTSTMTTPITLRPGPTDDLTVSPQEVGRDDRLSPSKSRRRVNVSVTFDQETVNPLTEGGQEVDQVTVSTRVGDTKREEVTEREDGEEREIRVKPADKGESRTPTVHQQPLSREESGGEEVGEEDGDKEEDEREASADEEEEVGYEEDVVEDEGGEGEKKQLESAATNYDLVLYEIKSKWCSGNNDMIVLSHLPPSLPLSPSLRPPGSRVTTAGSGERGWYGDTTYWSIWYRASRQPPLQSHRVSLLPLKLIVNNFLQ